MKMSATVAHVWQSLKAWPPIGHAHGLATQADVAYSMNSEHIESMGSQEENCFKSNPFTQEFAHTSISNSQNLTQIHFLLVSYTHAH